MTTTVRIMDNRLEREISVLPELLERFCFQGYCSLQVCYQLICLHTHIEIVELLMLAAQ
jgi:hypothetical protein